MDIIFYLVGCHANIILEDFVRQTGRECIYEPTAIRSLQFASCRAAASGRCIRFVVSTTEPIPRGPQPRLYFPMRVISAFVLRA